MPQRRIRRPGSSDQTLATQPPAAQGWKAIPILKSTLLLCFILLIVMPPIPYPLWPGLDPSWAFGLNMGHLDKIVFGRDIVFTYGPLGYLVNPAFPEAEPWAVFVFNWGIALLTAYALWKLSKRARHWTEAGLYLGVFWVCSAFVFELVFDSTIERMLALIIAQSLLIAIRLDDGPWFDLGLLFFLAAAALLAKFNLGILASLVAFYFAAVLWWRHRLTWRLVLKPLAAGVLVWISTLLGLYWWLDGTLGGLGAFLRNSAEVASGYSDAMAVAGPLGWAVGALLSVLVLLICVPLAAGEIRRIGWGIPPLLIISFLCAKSALVRQDIHPLPFPFQMAEAALLIVALASTPRSRIVVGAFALAMLDWGIVTVTDMSPQFLPTSMNRLTGHAAFVNLDGFLHWPATVSALESATQRNLLADQLPAEFLPYVRGKRVSAYPWEIAMIRANHLQWQPLPVFQAYSAYTPALDRMNAEKLDSASGPEAILLAWAAISGRHPFYETPQSWRALLNWYDIQLTSPGLYVLRRRSTPRFSPPVSTGEVVAHWDEKITLPPVGEDEVLIMQAQVRESLRGIVKRTLFRSPVIDVYATLRSGATVAGRVVRPNLEDGVLVSEYPRRLSDLAALLAGGFSDSRVASIRFHTEARQEFDPAIEIHWSRVKLRHDLN